MGRGANSSRNILLGKEGGFRSDAEKLRDAQTPEEKEIEKIIRELAPRKPGIFTSTNELLKKLSKGIFSFSPETEAELTSILLDSEVQTYQGNALGQAVAKILFEDGTGTRITGDLRDWAGEKSSEIVNLKGELFDYGFIETLIYDANYASTFPRPVSALKNQERWKDSFTVASRKTDNGEKAAANLHHLERAGLVQKFNPGVWQLEDEIIVLHKFFYKGDSLFA